MKSVKKTVDNTPLDSLHEELLRAGKLLGDSEPERDGAAVQEVHPLAPAIHKSRKKTIL